MKRSEFQRSLTRHLTLESLEARQLLAVGPELVAISPNAGDADGFLADGDLLDEAPTAMTIEFSPGQALAEDSLEHGIQVIRSNFDGTFDPARAITDFNTDNAVELEFRSIRTGDFGNSITIEVTKAKRGPGGGIGLTLGDNSLSIELNSTPDEKTRAQDLVDAINNHPLASALVAVSIVESDPPGDPETDITTIPNETTFQL
jgi:hypothetical protein